MFSGKHQISTLRFSVGHWFWNFTITSLGNGYRVARVNVYKGYCKTHTAFSGFIRDHLGFISLQLSTLSYSLVLSTITGFIHSNSDDYDDKWQT